MKQAHKDAISKAKKGHKVSKETRKKIGDANRGVWVDYKCDFCGKDNSEKQSHYNKKKRHFCSTKCYAKFRKEFLPKEEHNSFGHGYTIEERKIRRQARSILNHAIRDGLLTRKNCEVCHRKAEAHHSDYAKPLDVKWLCFYHHRKHHNQNPELLTPNH